MISLNVEPLEALLHTFQATAPIPSGGAVRVARGNRLLQAVEFLAEAADVPALRRDRESLHIVGIEVSRAGARGPILGRVTRSLALRTSGQVPDVRKGMGGNAARRRSH